MSREKYIVRREDGLKDYEFDPLTGLKTTIDYSEYEDTGKVIVKRTMDYETAYEFANTLRKKGEGVHKSSKEHWNHYAIIPVLTQLEMMKAGIDIDRDTKAVVQYINKFHPELKVTNLMHHATRKLVKNPKVVVK